MVSDKLRKYYHKVVVVEVMLGMWELGTEATLSEVHAYLKHRFLKVWIINETTWEYEAQEGTTKHLTNKEAIQYIEAIQRFAAEYLNRYIGDPNEWKQVKYESTELK